MAASSSRATWPGYDYLVQAETGYFAALNGEPDATPSRFGLSIIDFMTGYCLAMSLVAGLLDARRSGVGRDIDVCLYDVGLANLNYMATWAMNGGYQPERSERSAHPSLVPCQLFPTEDGWIYIMANKEKFFPLPCDRLDAPHLSSDPRFSNFQGRRAHCRTDIRTRSAVPSQAHGPMDRAAGRDRALRADPEHDRGACRALHRRAQHGCGT